MKIRMKNEILIVQGILFLVQFCVHYFEYFYFLVQISRLSESGFSAENYPNFDVTLRYSATETWFLFLYAKYVPGITGREQHSS